MCQCVCLHPASLSQAHSRRRAPPPAFHCPSARLGTTAQEVRGRLRRVHQAQFSHRAWPSSPSSSPLLSSFTSFTFPEYAHPSGQHESFVSGKSSPAGAAACLECPVGKYQDATEQSACKSCTAGRANPLQGQSHAYTCRLCDKGKAASAGSSVCAACPLGREAPDYGASHCVVSPPTVLSMNPPLHLPQLVSDLSPPKSDSHIMS